MICINIQFLSLIGLHTAGGGLSFSPLFSFGGGGNMGRDTAALETESVPRHLILVGMSDRYGVGSDRCASVIEVCVDAQRLGPRAPHPHEALALAADLESCAHPLAARIGARLLQFAGSPSAEL
jgi:hypothetical protein